MRKTLLKLLLFSTFRFLFTSVNFYNIIVVTFYKLNNRRRKELKVPSAVLTFIQSRPNSMNRSAAKDEN